jgi:hypothetical protein
MLVDPTVTERAVVVQLLDREQPAMPAELYVAIRGSMTPSDIDAAVFSLTVKGVIQKHADGTLRTTPVLEYLDTLGLICV